MKLNYSSILLIFGILLIPNISFAKTFSQTGVTDVIPVVGRIDNATQSWSGSLITDFDSRMPVNIDAAMNIKTGTPTESQEMYFDNTTGTFSGFFVLTAACATTSCKDTSGNWDASAFIAFNHGVTGLSQAKLIDSGDQNIYTMTGFAWSKSSGWIAFNAGPDPVKYNLSTSSFSGYAWSKNLGYINMNGLKMKAKPSILLEKDVTVANDSAILGYNSGSFDGLGVYRLMLNSMPYASNNGEFASVDIHNVLSNGYDYVLLDPFGNKTAGKLQVVANVPSDTCISGSCPVIFDAGVNLNATATENGNNFHKVILSLHDKYNNPIHTEASLVDPNKFVKEVKVNISFSNSVWADQSNISFSTDKAITYNAPGTVFSGSFDGTFRNIDAIGDTLIRFPSESNIPIIVSSIAPTNSSSGYTLKLDKFVYQITGVNGYTDTEVGGTTNDATFSAQSYDFKSPIQNAAVTLNPKIAGIALQTGEPFMVDAFSIPVTNNNISTAQVNLLFDFTTNAGSSLNTIIVLTGGQALTPQMSLNKIDRYISGFAGNGELTPTIQIGGAVDPGLGYKFSVDSYLKYTASGVNVIIPYALSGDQTVKNRGIKIIGTTSTSNSGSIFALSTQDEYTKVGNFSKPQVKDFVRQNVEAIIRNKPSDVLVKTADYEYVSSDMTGIRTLIIKDHDLLINSDVGTTGSAPMAIIVMNGNIKIGPNAKNIYASIFTDKGLYAVQTNGSLIDDSSRSSNQLYIFGTLISGNTVGTSAQSVNSVCPDFLPKTCSSDEKKRYDLNFLRTGPTNFASAISSEIDLNVYPVVIRYNPKLTSDPPPGFKKIAR